MTICILFLQVFSKKKKLSGVGGFFYVLLFVSFYFFNFFPFLLLLRRRLLRRRLLQPALPLEGGYEGGLLMVFNPYMSPFADDSAGMVSERS